MEHLKPQVYGGVLDSAKLRNMERKIQQLQSQIKWLAFISYMALVLSGVFAFIVFK